MNPQQARALVRDTFTQAFDRNRFLSFISNLLNHIDESKSLICNRQYVKDAFKPHVNRYERLATYTDPDDRKLDILIVYLTEEEKLTRARTALRNCVADYLNQRGRKDAALVAFVSPSESIWRFSYIKMEYSTVEKSSGVIDAEARLTPAKRFSYLVGPAESCHTAQSRFLELLQDTQSSPSLADIEEAFSVEAVTREFFQSYKGLFLQVLEELDKLVKADRAIADDFAARKVNTADFAKKLMGQIVFLHFLQKKGWLGVPEGKVWGDGPHNFLRKLANGDYGRYSNFFNDILEPLFYDTLAADRGHEAFCQRFGCRIPFLNGGLFEPLNGYDWRKTEILLPNRLFTNNDSVEEGLIGTGILDIFDRYNFTVNEAEPLEKEVAIDPEMLGKVFENLLEVKERKSKGSFYTPREIVHYMCQESLINYLDTAINSSTDIPVCELNQGDTDIPVCRVTQSEGGTDIPVCVPTSEIHKTTRNLPHWTSEGSVYWITFRLADSLPQEKLNAWRAEREIWLNQHPQPWSDKDWKEYDESSGERLQSWLDAGYGSCALMRPDVRQIVQDCLLRFDGERLRLHNAVIMPNHVHLLLEPVAGNELSELLKGIKGASARKANQILGNTGTAFWMDESYDHIVRSERQRQHFIRYIAENPVKAKLPAIQFWLYQGDTGIPACTLPQGGTDIPVCMPSNPQGGTGIPACIPSKTPSQRQETQTGMSVLPLPLPQTRTSVPRCDIETLVHSGDQAAHYEAARVGGTVSYAAKLPASIEKNARRLDEALAAITVCDPAIGSGAFPVGMMQEIVRARSALTPYFNDVNDRTPYHFKRHAIQNCLYGVDIDPGAVEIAKLRLWLSLVVDEEDVQQIKPLPNLDYKVVVGNSLLGVEKTLFNENLLGQLEELKPKYFNETDGEKKRGYKSDIDRLIHQLTNGNETFDFEIYFSEVFRKNIKGFDIVIANPPYVPIKGIPEPERRAYEARYQFANGRFNLFYLFIERCGLLSIKRGVAAFIIPDRLLLNTQCGAIRAWLLNRNSLCELISFGNQVFEAAVVDSIILIFQNQQRISDFIKAKVKLSENDLHRAMPIQIPAGYFVLSPTSQFDLNYNPAKHRLLSKIGLNSVALESISDTKDGIIQGKVADKLFLKARQDRDSKPLLFGANISRYKISDMGDWVNYKPHEMAEEEARRRGKNARPGLWMRTPSIFERPKILTRQTADEIIAAYDQEHHYYANTLHGTAIMNRDYHPHYVLGILNGKITTWFYRSSTDEEGKVFAQIKIEVLRRLPIPKASQNAQKPIIGLVNKIVSAKNANPAADTSALEREIDQIVYNLYDLAPEEIAIVEGSAAPQSKAKKHRGRGEPSV